MSKLSALGPIAGLEPPRLIDCRGRCRGWRRDIHSERPDVATRAYRRDKENFDRLKKALVTQQESAWRDLRDDMKALRGDLRTIRDESRDETKLMRNDFRIHREESREELKTLVGHFRMHREESREEEMGLKSDFRSHRAEAREETLTLRGAVRTLQEGADENFSYNTREFMDLTTDFGGLRKLVFYAVLINTGAFIAALFGFYALANSIGLLDSTR